MKDRTGFLKFLQAGRSLRRVVAAGGLGGAMAVSAAATVDTAVDTIRLGDGSFAVDIACGPSAVEALRTEFGPRFDMTAFVQQVTLGGYPFLRTPWGLTDEIGLRGRGVLGYDASIPDTPFLKIGVGRLGSMAKPYIFHLPCPILELAETRRTVFPDGRTIGFEQEASLPPWGYRYTKTYTVDPSAAKLTIAYTLVNTGTEAFPFEQYNHNWFRFGGTVIGEGYSLELPPPAVAMPDEWPDWLRRTTNGVELTRAITKPTYRPPVSGWYAADNRVTLRHQNGAAIEFSGDFDVHHFALYADTTAICPEVFFDWPRLDPGATQRWERVYTFTAPPAAP